MGDKLLITAISGESLGVTVPGTYGNIRTQSRWNFLYIFGHTCARLAKSQDVFTLLRVMDTAAWYNLSLHFLLFQTDRII